MRASLIAATLLTLSVAACGTASVAPSTPPATPADPTVAPLTPAATPEPTSTPVPTSPPVPTPTQVIANAAPPELAGVWRTTEGERISLSFVADRYTIARGPGSARGKLAVRDTEIELFGSDLCVGSGFYAWQVASGILTLVPTGDPDPCANRLDAVANRSFTKD
jgi:hypothetical protein